LPIKRQAVKLHSAVRNLTRSGRELQSVGSALDLLRAMADADGSIGVTEAARLLSVAPSTAHRLLTTFVAHGFAMRSPAGRGYRRGPVLIRLYGRRPIRLVLLRDAAHAVLERVSHETGETAHLSILEGLDVVGIDHVESVRPVIYRHPIGSRVPSHATAVGHALLAHSPEAAEALIAEGLDQLTDETVPHGSALRRSLDDVRRRGYAINDRQWHPETAGVAAPILDASGEAVAALGISGPSSRLNKREMLERLGRVARGAAAEISARLPESTAHPHG
jgi:DNA-binding IclR family transcriptional regulator